MDTYHIILLAVCYLFATLVPLAFLRKSEDTLKSPDNDYETLLAILNNVIAQELRYRHDDYTLRDLKMIYDIEAELASIVKSVMLSMSPGVLGQLEFYHPRKYIIKYITKAGREFLFKYTNENKIKTT